MYLTPYEIYRKLTVKDSIPAMHINDLSDVLMNVTLNDDYYDRLCVSQPPRTAKSSLITLSYPFWLVLNNPDYNIVIVNNTQTLAENFGIRLRQLFIDYKEFLELNDIKLSDTKHSNSFFIFEHLDGTLYDGSIKLMGTGGTITGQNVDILICDDLIKGHSDVTPTLLNKKIEWFKSIILQRLEPQSKLIILGTRWHSNDVIGYLEKTRPKDYKFITLQALSADETNCIWDNRYTPEFFIDRRAEIGDRLFEALYQQKPLDETGDFFDLNKIHFDKIFDPNTTPIIAKVRSWDLAYSDQTKGEINDSTAGILMHKVNDNHYVITNLKHGQYGDNLKNVILTTAQQDTTNTPILIETGTSGGAAEFLYNEYSQYLIGFRTQQSKPIGTKSDRATPLKEAILDGKIHIALTDNNTRGKLIEQFKSFPLGQHDDIVDACAYAYNYLKQVNTNANPISYGLKIG